MSERTSAVVVLLDVNFIENFIYCNFQHMNMIQQILIKLGMNEKIARVIEFVLSNNVKELTGRDIEINCDIRQPEVSWTMKQLVELGCFSVSERKKAGKGRPYKVYKPNIKKIKEFIEEFIHKKEEEVNQIIDMLDKLKQVVSSL